jgi:tRNA(Leu) C34 or U34 (ribose-2'-O)-methylase TrmL
MNEKSNIGTWGKKAPPRGVTPAIALVNPRYPKNVGMVVRLASCYGLKQVWFTGKRVSLNPAQGERLPREERTKGYKEVEMIHYDYFFDQFPAETVPVAVEVRANSESLHTFEHAEHALYVFGPEDGTISQTLLRHCHRFLVIPTRHCLNLATAVASVLWDRESKRIQTGRVEAPVTPGDFEKRGLVEAPDDLVFGTD